MPNEFSQIPLLAKWIVIAIGPPLYIWLTAKPYWSRLLVFLAKKYQKPAPEGGMFIAWNTMIHLALVVAAVILWSIYHWLRWLSGVIFG